jgi:hypothetical protein
MSDPPAIVFSSRGSLPHAIDGFQHTDVRETPAQDAGHGLANLLVAGLRVLIEEGFGGHNDAVDAKSALRGLLGDKRALKRMGLVDGAYPFECGDFRSSDRADGGDAGADSLTFHDDSARAALAQSATELGTTEFEIVAQHVKQRGGGVDVEGVRLPINFQRNRAHINTKVWLRLARVKPRVEPPRSVSMAGVRGRSRGNRRAILSA